MGEFSLLEPNEETNAAPFMVMSAFIFEARVSQLEKSAGLQNVNEQQISDRTLGISKRKIVELISALQARPSYEEFVSDEPSWS